MFKPLPEHATSDECIIMGVEWEEFCASNQHIMFYEIKNGRRERLYWLKYQVEKFEEAKQVPKQLVGKWYPFELKNLQTFERTERIQQEKDPHMILYFLGRLDDQECYGELRQEGHN